MPAKLDLRSSLLKSPQLDQKWRIQFTICDRFGWDLAPLLGWLLIAEEHGLTKPQLAHLCNLNIEYFETLFDKLISLNITKNIKYPRQLNASGIALDLNLAYKFLPDIHSGYSLDFSEST